MKPGKSCVVLFIAIGTFLGPQAWAIGPVSNCGSLRNALFNEFEGLVHKVGIIETDDRALRPPGSQEGRIWCPKRGQKLKKFKAVIQKKELYGYSVANATLAFDGESMILPRHMLAEDNGTPITNASNCVFEHVSSGEILRIVDGEFDRNSFGENAVSRSHDYAVARLDRTPNKGTFLTKDEIMISPGRGPGRNLKILSNYADNLEGQSNEASTVTDCTVQASLKANGQSVNQVGTNCDTGAGTSGAGAYTTENNEVKLFGIVTGNRGDGKDKDGYNTKNWSTEITTFDETLPRLYEAVKNRTGT